MFIINNDFGTYKYKYEKSSFLHFSDYCTVFTLPTASRAFSQQLNKIGCNFHIEGQLVSDL